MTTLIQKYWQGITGKRTSSEVLQEPARGDDLLPSKAQEVDISPSDPLLPHLLNAPGVVEILKLNLDSPALRDLKAAGVKVVVPLISQGELIGLLNLGARLSEQEYSSYDYQLLTNLATQAAPALRVAQMARQQQIEARERERIEQELRVARVIQQTLLPKELPALPGWRVAAHWQPARAVSGDFYDFVYFPDGKLGLVMGDVTDKGVPAALVMATTRSVLRAAAEQLVSPSKVLERVNNLLCPDIPANMFITCLYAVLDPVNGKMNFSNAGHNLPYKRTAQGVEELRATGMPLGLLPGMTYEEEETVFLPGENMIIYSDGLVEAHNPEGEMFGFPRLRSLLADHPGGEASIELLVAELQAFTGQSWEQEDDVTFLTLEYVEAKMGPRNRSDEPDAAGVQPHNSGGLETLAAFELPSIPGNEREAMERVSTVIQPLSLDRTRLERLQTAVAEATMNAMEHGNQYQADLPVLIQILASKKQLTVRITDQGGERAIPELKDPDLEAKLAGLQSPRGWGFFLIRNMVDEMNISSDQSHHTVELVLKLEDG